MAAIIPVKIGAGLTFETLATLADYPAPDWSLSVALRGPSSINLVATASGAQHLVAATAAQTAAWAPGDYWCSVRATKAGQVVEVEAGQVTVTPDLAAAPDGYDGTSHAQRVLTSIEAVIEKRATLDQERYRINNRELQRTPLAELMKLRDLYRAEVRRDKLAASGKSLFGATVRVRLQ